MNSTGDGDHATLGASARSASSRSAATVGAGRHRAHHHHHAHHVRKCRGGASSSYSDTRTVGGKHVAKHHHAHKAKTHRGGASNYSNTGPIYMHPAPKNGVYLKQYQMQGIGKTHHVHKHRKARRVGLMGGAADSMAPGPVQSNRFDERVRKPAKTWSALPLRRKRKNEPAVKSFYGVGRKGSTSHGGAWYHDAWNGVKKGAHWAWEHREQIAKAAQLAAKALGAGRRKGDGCRRLAKGGLRRMLHRKAVARPTDRLMSGMGTFGLGRRRAKK